MTHLTVVILTRDEARHIKRAIASVAAIADRIVVVDSGSTDETVALAKVAGAEVLQHKWTTHAGQFNWALDQLGDETGWVLRLDADEVVTAPLACSIAKAIGGNGPEVGFYLPRRIHFMGQPVRFGGVFPVYVMRLFRSGIGRCEDRWMDEHIVVQGPTARLNGELIDDNLNPLHWWIAKHNAYASREVIDVLNAAYGFMPVSGQLPGRGQAAMKRWMKSRLYARLPGGLRAGLYFIYRYVLRLGFLDGREARRFHVLQGFWYRYLVDAKLAEVRNYMAEHDVGAPHAIRDVLGIELREGTKARAA